MASLPTTVILLSILFSGLFYATGGDNVPAKLESTITEQREFDYFSLALQWPATFCSKTTKCCKQNICCRGGNFVSGFTIHGLWASYNNGSWPSCCSDNAFDETEISSLRGVLDMYWPTLSCSNTSTCHNTKGSFWAHEWEKHGTCSFAVTGKQYNYFLTGLNLYFSYNLTEVLVEAGYMPSNSEMYPSSGIISAIENAFHTTPQLACNRKNSINEVRLCFTKDFKFRDCVGSSNCPDYVSLPEFVSLNDTKAHGSLFFGIESS